MCSLCQLPMAKNHNFGQILTFSALLYRPPFTDEVQICAPYAYVSNFVWIGLFCRPLLAKTPQFLPFFGLRHLMLSPIGNSLTKLNMGAQLQTFPYPTVSKSFLYSNAFMAKLGAQSLTFKSVTKRHTNRQKTQRFSPPRRRVKSEAHQTWHVDRGPRARSWASKTFGVCRTLSPLKGTENLGITRPRRLKIPITP